MNEILIIRHGQTYGNKNNILCGSTDTRLTKEGKEALACKKIDICEDTKFYTSTLSRTQETLLELFPNCEQYKKISGLDELHLKDYENKCESEFDIKQLFKEWLHEDMHFESYDEFKSRVLTDFSSIVDKEENSVIVTHHMVIRLLMVELNKEEKNCYFDNFVENGCGFKIIYDNKQIKSISEI